MPYNLTESQKNILCLLVENKREGKLSEPIILAEAMDGTSIAGFSQNFGHNFRGEMNALVEEDLLRADLNSGGDFIYYVKQKGYDAVDNNFEPNDEAVSPQINIGNYIEAMKGGNVQGIGTNQNSTVQQIINEPELFKAEIERLMTELLDAVKGEIEAKYLPDYLSAIAELKEELHKEKANPSAIHRLVATLGFFGDVEGTISLTIRALPYLQALLLLVQSFIANL